MQREKAKTREQFWREWLIRLKQYAMSEAEMIPDLTADYWRECFESGMPPEIAFRESFVEQDGL